MNNINKIHKRAQQYFQRTKRLPKLYNRFYIFLREVYWYMTGFNSGDASRSNVYDTYISIVNLGLISNQESIDPNKYKLALAITDFLIKRESKSNFTFITLNNSTHIELMHKFSYEVITQSMTLDYLSYVEFYTILEKYRKIFYKNRINLFKESSKIQLKDLVRFSREPNPKYTSKQLKDKARKQYNTHTKDKYAIRN